RHTRFSRDWSSDVCSSDLFLLGLQQLRAAVDQLPFERAAELYLLYALALKVLRGFYARLCGASVSLSDQNTVVDLMDRERHIVRSEERRVGKECSCRWER